MRGLTTGLLCVAIALWAVGCDGNPSTQGAAPRNSESDPDTTLSATDDVREPGLPVRTWRIRPSDFQEILEVTGTLEAWDEVQLSSELGGYVREVDFDKGQAVRKGQVLARIGDDLARTRLEQARAELEDAEATHRKVEALYSREAVPEQELISATARLARTRAAVREFEILLERSEIRSPIDGVAVDRSLDPGEVLAPGAPVTMVQRLDRLKVETSVPDTEINWIMPGSSASVYVDAWPDRTFQAKVSFVSPAADSIGRTFEVELDLPNRDLTLRPGMVCRVRLIRRMLTDAVAVPLDALVARVDGRVAFVVEDCRAALRSVAVSAIEGGRALVATGLAVGDELVVAGQQDLADGQPVDTETCR